MPRPEGPSKIQRIDDLLDTLKVIGGLIGEPPPTIHRGMWYNIDRDGIERLNEFLNIVERRLSHALDSPRRLSPHEESLDPTQPKPVG